MDEKTYLVLELTLMKRSLSSFALFAFGLWISSGVLADESNSGMKQVQESDYQPFLSWFDESTNELNVPGGALAIVSKEGVQHLQTFGVRDVNSTGIVDSESIFRIASMSKTFAGTATALLVDQELQTWDTLLTDLFPELNLGTRSSSKGINLRHVISHSTGLMPHSYSNMLDDGVSYDRIKSKFDEIPTVCSPGDCYGYQNVVFSIAGEVVEQSTGTSYESYLEEQIFKPLGMVTASVGLESYNNSEEKTSPHRKYRSGWRSTSTNPAYYTVAPASGINASIFDMTLWLRANLGAFPSVLSHEFLDNLHEPIIPTPRGNYFNRWRELDKAYYATGWRVFDYAGLRAVHHGGGVRGYRSEMVFVPELNIGLVLMFNAETKLANDVVPAFLDGLTSTN